MLYEHGGLVLGAWRIGGGAWRIGGGTWRIGGRGMKD